MTPCPKPQPRKKAKARRDRVESKVAQAVRALVSARDGDCRLQGLAFGECRGEQEWCHLGDNRRFRTRGMAPEKRHSTSGTVCLCTGHHDQLDGRARPRIDIQPLSSHGADGRLGISCGGHIHIEPERTEATA